MREVVILSAVRTPIGSIGGTLKNILPETLLKIAYEGAIKKAGIDREILDEVIAGQAKQSTDAPNIARVASLMLQVPEHVPSYTVHRQCASGMQAMLSGMQQIQCGYSDTVLVGGVESMSTAPFYIRNARFGVGNGNTVFVDPNIESQPKSQPNDLYGTFNMIQTADNVARQFKVSREEQDQFALTSQQRAVAAIDAGKFKDEIVPVIIPQKKKDPIYLPQMNTPSGIPTCNNWQVEADFCRRFCYGRQRFRQKRRCLRIGFDGQGEGGKIRLETHGKNHCRNGGRR